MALGSCYSCIKYLMFAFNFIFWMLGCAILGIGIWLRVDDAAAEYSKADSLEALAYIFIAIGFVIMLIGFLGCCGAIRESQCMLASFFLALFLIFAALLGAGIWAVVAKGSFEDITQEWLEDGVKDYHSNSQAKTFMDSIQHSLDCCGAVKGEVDYATVGGIPDTCAPQNYRKFQCCGATIGGSEYKTQPPPCHDEDVEKPCHKALYEMWKDRLVLAAGISIGIAVIMILGMIFSMVLCCAIRDTMA